MSVTQKSVMHVCSCTERLILVKREVEIDSERVGGEENGFEKYRNGEIFKQERWNLMPHYMRKFWAGANGI